MKSNKHTRIKRARIIRGEFHPEVTGQVTSDLSNLINIKISISYILLVTLFIAGNSMTAQSWKSYPHHQSGSVIHFPADEGRHPTEPTEWWYTIGHLTGDSTGNQYSYMLTYFYYPKMSYDGFRILTVSNETTGKFYDQTLPCNYTNLSADSLNIQADPFGGSPEEWKNTTDSSGHAEPFQYFFPLNHKMVV